MIQQHENIIMITKFPGLFERHKQKIWDIDSHNKLLICSDPKNSSKKQTYNIAHLQVLEGERDTKCIVKLQVNQQIHLEAPTKEAKNKWMRKIKQIHDEIKNFKKKNQVVLNNNKKSRKQSTKEIQMADLNKQSRTLASKLLKKGIYTSSVIANQTLPVSMQILHSIGLSDFIKYLEPSFIQYNIVSGKHRVKKREVFSIYKQKYLLLISSKSLYPEKHVTDVMLMQSQLPAWFDLNTLYQFQPQKEKRKVMFNAKDIIQIGEIIYESDYHVIRVNTGKRIHSLGFEMYVMAKKWKQLLNIASRNAHEIEQNGVKIKKNIDPLIVELTEKRLHERLIAFYQTNKPNNYVVPELMQFLGKVKFQLQSTCDAAKAKQPPQLQLISFYFDYFHQKIFLQIKLTWDKGFETMPPIYMVQLIKWLEEYCYTFMDYVTDNRMQLGISTLCKIAGRKISRELRPLIVSIAETDKHDNFFEEDGVYFTNSIIDVFKFVNDSINIYFSKGCSKQLMWIFCVLANIAFKAYINSLKQIVDENNIVTNQLIAITNNSGFFIGSMAQFVEDRVHISKMDADTIKVYLESEQLCRSFNELSTITRDKLQFPFIDKIGKYYRGRKYLTIKIQNLLRMLFESDTEIDKLSSINRRIFWKQILSTLVVEIIRCISNSYEKNKTNLLQSTISKIREDLNTLSEQFQQIIGMTAFNTEKDKITKVLIVLSDQQAKPIIEIFTNKEFKDHAYMVKLIEYRTDAPTLQQRIHRELQQIQNEGNGNRRSTIKAHMSKKRKSTIYQNYGPQEGTSIMEQQDQDDDDQEPEDYSDEGASTVDNPVTISEGYMQKKKDDRKFFETRFFRLKKGHLYWYADQQSSVCQNQLDLSQMQEIVVKSPQKPTFVLMIKNHSKICEYKLKCQSVQIRQLWVRSIQSQFKKINNNKQKCFKPIKFEERSTLIIDYEQANNPLGEFNDQFSDQRRLLHDSKISLKKPQNSGKNSRKTSNFNLTTKSQKQQPSGFLSCFYALFE